MPYSEQRQFAQLLIYGTVRAPLIALGRKLIDAGIIEEPNDVFMLSLEEATAALQTSDGALFFIVERRKRDLEHWQTLTPPLSVGKDPSNRAMTDAQRQFMRLFRGPATRLDAPDPGATIKGMAASRGSMQGTARVLRDLSQADRLRPGDVLVCRTHLCPVDAALRHRRRRGHGQRWHPLPLGDLRPASTVYPPS